MVSYHNATRRALSLSTRPTETHDSCMNLAPCQHHDVGRRMLTCGYFVRLTNARLEGNADGGPFFARNDAAFHTSHGG